MVVVCVEVAALGGEAHLQALVAARGGGVSLKVALARTLDVALIAKKHERSDS